MALSGIKVVEFAGLAPGPFAGLVLADNGASVIRIDRPSSTSRDVLSRGKRSLAINPKTASGRDVLRKLMATADVVIDPFRPGVMERLGLGPEVFLRGEGGLNGRLVFARIAGFPRRGQYEHMAGHDINYLALSGVLSMLPGSDEKPAFPLNLVADFAGGGLACVTGILLALVERGTSGRGQVVDTDMVSGTRYLSSFPLIHHALQSSPFDHERGQNALDGGAPYYNIYTCQDGRWMSVGCLEPRFYAAFLERFVRALPPKFSVDGDWRPTSNDQHDRNQWPRLKTFLSNGFKVHPRNHWADVFRDSDSCAVPVLTPAEAAELYPSGSPFPSAHPRVSAQRTSPAVVVCSPSRDLILRPGEHTLEVLEELGLNERERICLALDGALGDAAQAEARVSSKL